MAKPKEIPGLDCEAGAGEGARRVLLARFEEMCEYRAAALEGADIEGVHDMRVASRRLRSALRDFVPRLRRGKRLDAAREALERLADALGAVRDEDVAIHALEKLKEEAPPEAVAGVEEYAGERRARRERARAELADAIGEAAVEEARRLLARALQGKGPKKGDDGADFAAAQRAVVRRLWGELGELSPSLHRPYKTRRLHKMRIAAKRLRYALELFECCRRDGEAKSLAGEVADMQGELGDLHDCDVWAEDLGGQLGGGDGRAALSEERKRAVVWLLGHFVQKRAAHYRAALTLWHDWERGRAFEARLESALRPAPAPDITEEQPAEEQTAPA
ncbi:MAG TPA: CHAD domain-containing protein [Pyrinomonadaceae bacterium]|nr:CHAD domain-containing protein [Pyrinomonadaceae bacterium]